MLIEGAQTRAIELRNLVPGVCALGARCAVGLKQRRVLLRVFNRVEQGHIAEREHREDDAIGGLRWARHAGGELNACVATGQE